MTTEIDGFSGLKIAVEKFEDTSMSNGENAFILYLKLDNQTSQTKKINLLKATYVAKNREQLEQDIWLSGYIIGEDNLKPNSFKKAGLVFYKSKLKKISENDLLYVSIELPKDGAELTLCFQYKGNEWSIINTEQTEIEIKLTPKQFEKRLIKKIERLEAFEERLGVSLQNLSLKIDDSYIWATIYCEVHSTNGTTLEDALNIECVLYDNDGSIIDKKSAYIDSDDFFGFELIELTFTGDISIAEQVSKIRIYPKK
ncbi:MAG: hypothetical protein KDE33_19555 [Bacteroidetes bacterium]|nr:hypothetical protein [Bacteroidota bacterium]